VFKYRTWWMCYTGALGSRGYSEYSEVFYSIFSFFLRRIGGVLMQNVQKNIFKVFIFYLKNLCGLLIIY